MSADSLNTTDDPEWSWAARIAADHLATMGDRWSHTQAVGRQASRASVVLSDADKASLIAAAWLHDIGYAPDVADTGFHPLDGARFLERLGVSARLVNLVANHSCARFEADERHLLPQLEAYAPEIGPVADALVYADMTTSPSGAPVSVEQRLAEILRRYPPRDPVHRAISEASSEIKAAVSRVERLLAERSDQPI